MADAKNRKPTLAIVGQYQNGKSTLLNCLLGGCYAIQGGGLATTRYNATYTFGEIPEMRILSANGHFTTTDLSADSLSRTIGELADGTRLSISVYSPFLIDLNIMDSPGWGAKDDDNKSAETALVDADGFIYVFTKTINEDVDLPFLKKIEEAGKPLFLVLNCLDKRPPSSSAAKKISDEIAARMKTEGLHGNCHSFLKGVGVYPVNLIWAEYALRCAPATEQDAVDGKVAVYFKEKNPDRGKVLVESGVSALRTAILDTTRTLARIPPFAPIHFLDRALSLLDGEIRAIMKG